MLHKKGIVKPEDKQIFEAYEKLREQIDAVRTKAKLVREICDSYGETVKENNKDNSK